MDKRKVYLPGVSWVLSEGDCVRSFYDKVHMRYKDSARCHRASIMVLMLHHNLHIHGLLSFLKKIVIKLTKSHIKNISYVHSKKIHFRYKTDVENHYAYFHTYDR